MSHPLTNYLQMFREIPEDEQDLIAKAFPAKHLREGDYLFEAGAVCQELFFIHSGVLRIVATNEKGQEVTHYFLKENQFCTILKSFNEGTLAEYSIQAACPAEVVSIKHRQLQALYKQLPYVREWIERILQQGLLDKIEVRNSYRGYDSSTRYQLFVLRQSDIATRVPLNYIASYLGITQQSLSRIRKGLGKSRS